MIAHTNCLLFVCCVVCVFVAVSVGAVPVEQSPRMLALPQQDPAGAFMIAWWELWHKQYTQLHGIASAISINHNTTITDSDDDEIEQADATNVTNTTTSNVRINITRQNALTNSLTSMLSSMSTSGSSTSLADVNNALLNAQQQVAQLQQIESSLRDKLKTYWDHLSNATLPVQPYPHARNVELHSEGIINNAITCAIEFDPTLDEDKLVSKYWFRFSADCTDLGKLDPILPPVLILQVDPLIPRYKTRLGPIRVPEGARCLMLYAADLLEMPFPNPVAIPLPDFRYPKPEINYATHCKVGLDACFDESSSNGTTCQSLMGMSCCHLPMCIGCKKCSQIRNLVVPAPRPRLLAVGECVDRWERQGFSSRFGFSCGDALRWGYMNCIDDVKFGLCRRTCHLCDPKLYATIGPQAAVGTSAAPAPASPILPSRTDVASPR